MYIYIHIYIYMCLGIVMTFSFLLAFVFRDIKVVILGDSSVGKTTLICRYMEGVFQSKKSVSTSTETNAVYTG